MGEVKGEIADIYRESLEGPVGNIQAALPTNILGVFGPQDEEGAAIGLKTFEELPRVYFGGGHC